ncbi:myb transcription factor family protein, partial [Trifolium medium]|nr:myb transcription factor family protein [Trifolium medium]
KTQTQSVEFYDFLQVDSNKSEVTDNARKDDEEVNQDVVKLQNKENNVPFIDFLSTGNC